MIFSNNQNKINKVYYLLTFLHTCISPWGAEAGYVSPLNKSIKKMDTLHELSIQRVALQGSILWACVRGSNLQTNIKCN